MAGDFTVPDTRQVDATFELARPGMAGGAGEAIEGIGREVSEFATQQYQAGQESNAIKARLGYQQDVDNLKLKYQDDPDPATAAQRYQADATALQKQYLGDVQMPALQDRLTEEFGQMAESGRIDVADYMHRRQISETAANLDQLAETQANAAAFAKSDAQRTVALNAYQQSVQGAIASGMMSPKDGELRVKAFNERLATYDARHAIFLNPGQALKDLSRGPAYLPSLPIDERQSLMFDAQAKVQEQAREARLATAQARATAAESLAGYETIVASGMPVSQDVIDQTKADVLSSGDPRLLTRFAGLQRAQAFSDSMRKATPAEVNQGIAAIEAQANKGGANEAMATAVTAAQKFGQHMSQALTRDPLMWANSQGVVQLKPLQLNGQDTALDWKNRVQQADLVAQHYGVAPKYLTENEFDTFKQAIDKGTTDQKLGAVGLLAQGLGSRAVPLLTELGVKDPALSVAGGLLLSGQAHAQAARDIVRGSEILKTQPDLKPARAVRTTLGLTNAGMVSRAFGALMPNEGGRVLSAADALYAANAPSQGLTGADAASGNGLKLYDHAVQLAAGARYDAQGTQWGGVVNYRGNSLVVPGWLRADGFGEIFHNISEKDLDHASASGSGPRVDGKPLPEGALRSMWPVSAGDGLYVLSTTDPSAGTITPVRDAKGAPFRLDLGKAASILQVRNRANQQ